MSKLRIICSGGNMKTNSKKFEDLLTEGIYTIQRIESKTKKKRISEIEEELAISIHRKTSTIEWFRQGHPPLTQFEIEQLAHDLYIRGHLDRMWVEAFLQSSGHPLWLEVIDNILCSNGLSDPTK